jgi:hypothetical protein
MTMTAQLNAEPVDAARATEEAVRLWDDILNNRISVIRITDGHLDLLASFAGGLPMPGTESLISLYDNLVADLIPRPNPGCVGGCGSAAGTGTPTSLPAGVPDDGGPVMPLPQGQTSIPALPADDLP